MQTISLLGTIFIVLMVVMLTTPSQQESILLPIPLPELTSEQPKSFWYLTTPVTVEDIGCLTNNIYFEARGDTIESQYATADVVMYRVTNHEFPDTICGVVKQGIFPPWSTTVPYKHRCSFSWFCDLLSDTPRDNRALGVAEYIAKDVLFNINYVPEVEYALYYHADYVNPIWAKTKYFIAQVGDHVYLL